MLKVFFDVKELYYLPQYQPIAEALKRLGVSILYVFNGSNSPNEIDVKQLGVNDDELALVGSEQEALNLYLKEKPDWLVIGNYFENISLLNGATKTALVSHGIGPKSCYYDVSGCEPSVRFVEGPYRTQRLQNMYPNQTFIDTGYAKLDPVVNGLLSNVKPSDYGLDDAKKTILYAPTFFPSSIENMGDKFPEEFSEYNIVLKPHHFSITSEKYHKQRKKLELWAKYDNVYLANVNDINLLPFMALADVLVSDASSALFEFAALDKPVVWCDFYKLRWGYRGLLSFRFKDRMDEDLYKYADIAAHASDYKELKAVVDSQLQNPDEFKGIRQEYTEQLAGLVDGCVSIRISGYMVSNND